MNRGQLIEKAAAIISGGYPGVGKVVARDVVDALLPQVATVKGLHDLPVGAVVIDIDGRPWRKRGWSWETWARKQVPLGELVRDSGPLTVAWQP